MKNTTVRSDHAAEDAALDPRARVNEYFAKFLTEKLRQRLLPDVHSLSAKFRISLNHPADVAWTLTVENGVLVRVSSAAEEVQCSYTLGLPVFQDIVAGRLAPQKAFFKRQVEIGGDIIVGLRVATVLGRFFKLFPCEI